MILQRDFFLASIAAVILCQSVIGQIEAAADSTQGSEMIRVPGGVFLMGNSDGPEDERPLRNRRGGHHNIGFRCAR